MHVKWLREGDTNTAFFHRMASMRYKSNKIHSMKVGEEIIQESAVHEKVYQHYKTCSE